MSGRILKFDISDCDSGLISRGKCALLVVAGLTQGARRALGISMNTLRRHDILRTITPTYYLVISACRLRKSRHGTQRGRAATETRNISRKGRARCHFDRREKSFSDPSHSLGMTDIRPSLGVLCALARVNSPVRVFELNGTFAQAAKILKDSSTKSPSHSGLRPPAPARVSAGIVGRTFVRRPKMRSRSSHVRSLGGILGMTRYRTRISPSASLSSK